MKDPKQLCREHNLYSYQAQKGAELMAEYIKDEVRRIMTTPTNSAVYEPLSERIEKFFNMK